MGIGRALWRAAQYGYVASSDGNSVLRSDAQEMTYAVSSHHMHHLSEIWDDVFNVTFQAMPVCKAHTGEALPVMSTLRV